MIGERKAPDLALQTDAKPNGRDPARSPRVVLYSHDTMGVGHARRNMLIAQALVGASPSSTILIIVGAHELQAFPLPPGVDFLTLPALYKEKDGSYRPRHLSISLEELIAVRAKTIRAAVAAFQPDVFLVDKEPRGALRELDPILDYLRGRKVCCLLGLRDILDDPEVVRREWAAARNEEAIRAHYAAVWIYGDPAVYNAVAEYGLAGDVAAKVRFTGYLNQRLRLLQTTSSNASPVAEALAQPGNLVVCAVGGGQDGDLLAEAFSKAELPADTRGVIVTGPFMPGEATRRLHSRAAANPRLRVLEFVPEADLLLSRADRIVTMGGYNSLCAVLSFDKPALVVPRIRPRREQAIRAERFRQLGLVDVLMPDLLSPQALSEWFAHPLGHRPRCGNQVDFGGAERLPRLLMEALDRTR